jgi:MoaA/NifB/PqqE/SkfB family radical SAM enzyme
VSEPRGLPVVQAEGASPGSPPKIRRGWLELALDYRCNLRCLGCRACMGEGGSMSGQQALSWLRWGRQRRLEGLWLGGGEPTLRPELLPLCKAGSALGYREIVVQTNGLRLAYPAFAAALAGAGATGVRLNVKTHEAAEHDRLSGSDGAHALLEQALRSLEELPLSIAADVLLTRSTLASLPATVAWYASRGVRAFSLWLLSAADNPDPAVRAEVPRIGELVPLLAEAAAQARVAGAVLETLHTPPCSLPEALRPLWKPAASWGLVVVDPSGSPFALERSPFEGGEYLPGCAACSARASCPGLRADYLAIHGDDGFVPLGG